MSILIKNIKGLIAQEDPGKWKAGSDMAILPVIEDAFLILNDGLIGDYGSMKDLEKNSFQEEIDASGRFVFPCFVDSHTHIIFPGSRENEFVDKIKGLSYQEIASKGGGILNSAKLLQKTSEEELFDQAMVRVNEVIGQGTGALEIKSGYGLTPEDELKMLRVARRIKENTPLTVKTTFLGAHAIPVDQNRDDYINLVLNTMIPQVADEGLADYCDVFCEKGFFSPDESKQILEQGLNYGLKPKVHANQLSLSRGVQVGVEVGAVSVDHLETVGDEEIEALKGKDTIATMLPGSAFFLRLPYPPARRMMEEGLALALASDYNPGSAPSGNMPFMISLACIQMRMTPEEAINAATLNGAYAMEVQDSLGTITRGKVGNVFITKEIPSYSFLPYAFGTDLVETVFLEGGMV